MTEEELASELDELARTLTQLEVGEGSALGGDGAAATAASEPGSVDAEAERTAHLVGLYNAMGVKLMDARKFEESVAMLRKASVLVAGVGGWVGLF